MHDLGDIVHFDVDDGLQDIVVLKPDWLTKAIGYVLEDRETVENNGELVHARLAHLWGNPKRDPQYEPQHHPYFLRLLEKFDVSRRMEGGENSLVAQLVPAPRPKLPWDGASNLKDLRELRLAYRLSEDVPGIIAWLTARNYRRAKGWWRRGVFLRHEAQGAEALFELEGAAELTLTVRGPAPDYFLSVLRDGVETLMNDRWPGLSYECFVPYLRRRDDGSPCENPNFRFELGFLETLRRKFLETLRRKNVPTTHCGCTEMQDVLKLLTGLETPGEPILSQLRRLTDEVAETKVYAAKAAAGIRRTLKAISAEVDDCPRFFALEAVDRHGWDPRNLFASSLKLTLWYEYPDHTHAWPDASYPLTKPRKWLEEAAPYITLAAEAIKIAGPIAGSAVGVALDKKILGATRIRFFQVSLGGIPR